jgi:hypothetical protein
MIGHSIFTHTPTTKNITSTYIKVTQEQYEDWQRQFTADALLGLRYGQSFCNRFGIIDNLLFFTREIAWCENYIKDHYLAR